MAVHQADAHPPVNHTHMPHSETQRMKALRVDRQRLLDQVVAINTELERLVEHEQRKVFAAFKNTLRAQAIGLHARDTSPPLDL